MPHSRTRIAWLGRSATMENVALWCLAVSLAPAQGSVPPFQLGLINPIPGLTGVAVGVGSVTNASFVHLPGQPAQLFYASLTVTGLSTPLGGVGQSDLLCGYYDAAADLFYPNSEAAALNSLDHDMCMSVYHNGLFAVFDRYNAWCHLATRAAIGQPWQLVGVIANVPPGQTFFGPNLVDYRGQPHLVFNFQSGIAMQPIDLVTAQLTGPLYQPTMIVGSSGGHACAGSAITDPNGEILGISYFELIGTHTDHKVAFDLDPATPGMLVLAATPNMYYTGCAFVGGRFFDQQFPGVSQLFAIDAVWCTGGRAPVGGTMDIRILTPPGSGPQSYVSLLGGGSSFLPQGIQVPGIQGLLGLNPLGWTSNLVGHNNANGEALVSLLVPNSPSLSGVFVPVQALTWELTSGAVFLGNTARLAVD